MPRKSKLLTSLDAQKGKDYEAEKRKRQVKAAEKKKREKITTNVHQNGTTPDSSTNGLDAKAPAGDEDFASFLDEDEEMGESESDGVRLNGTDSNTPNGALEEDDDEDDDEEDEEDQNSDIALSDLSASDLSDTIPHQRLTINNGPALLASQTRISLLRKQTNTRRTPFHIHNSLISGLPAASSVIADANDDLTRELEFYRIARTAALEARTKLRKESIPFSRPADYFAEMVKSDAHMSRIKKKMYDEAAERKGRDEARKMRDAKKFGKKVQVAKEQERARSKRETLDKIKDLKRKRKGQASEDVREDADAEMFESVSVETPGAKSRSGRERGPGDGKRQKKDARFGFGGKKRFSKSGDAVSSADISGFSNARMKGRPSRGGGKSQRLGKNRRAAKR